jgi:hypothetical protein
MVQTESQRRILVDKSCIDSKIREYVESLRGIKDEIVKEAGVRNSYDFLTFLKRLPLNSGPYPKVSLFETCNRIFSDLVLLIGTRRLLYELGERFPFAQYTLALGTASGNDIEAHQNNIHLVGEGFSVARQFFPTKRSQTIRKISRQHADYKIILFNCDAVANASEWDLREKEGICFITVKTEQYID